MDKIYAFTYAEILKMEFPETDEMKNLTIRDQGAENEFCIDPRSYTDDFLNATVHPVTDNPLWFAYVCPYCGKFHIQPKSIFDSGSNYHERRFNAPCQYVDFIQLCKEKVERKCFLIHLKDFDNMTVYAFDMYPAIITIMQSVAAVDDPELKKALNFLLYYGWTDGLECDDC